MERDIIKETTGLVNKIDQLIDETFSGIPELELTAIIAGRAEIQEFGAAIKGKHVWFRFIVEQGAADKYFPDMTGKRFELVQMDRPALTVRVTHKFLQDLAAKVDSLIQPKGFNWQSKGTSLYPELDDKFSEKPVKEKILLSLGWLNELCKSSKMIKLIKIHQPDFNNGLSTPLTLLKDKGDIIIYKPTGSNRYTYYGLPEWFDENGLPKNEYKLK